MNKQSKIQAKYDKKHILQISIRLHLENDKDIIEQIDSNNKQGSIKELIRKGMKGCE